MNDANEWIDAELIAAGQLLQSRGLMAPDRTQAPLSEVRAAVDRIGAFLGEGSVPLARERDLSLPGPHGQVPCRVYLPDDVERPPLLVYAHGGVTYRPPRLHDDDLVPVLASMQRVIAFFETRD